ncbi:MAG: hypothetical protein MZV70_73405 [Desulfobacterales bacterium]|nr:hypothetical protein [Desulfobacterales bacterium]
MATGIERLLKTQTMLKAYLVTHSQQIRHGCRDQVMHMKEFRKHVQRAEIRYEGNSSGKGIANQLNPCTARFRDKKIIDRFPDEQTRGTLMVDP